MKQVIIGSTENLEQYLKGNKYFYALIEENSKVKLRVSKGDFDCTYELRSKSKDELELEVSDYLVTFILDTEQAVLQRALEQEMKGRLQMSTYGILQHLNTNRLRKESTYSSAELRDWSYAQSMGYLQGGN